jgi:hypothetical protein
MSSLLHYRFVPLLAFALENDAVFCASVPFDNHAIERAQRYLAALTQSCRRRGRLLFVIREENNSDMGEEDGLALLAISSHLQIFSHVIERLDALESIRLEDELAACLTEVERLRADVEDAAGDWGVDATGASDWLPSRAPVSLLARCLLRRATRRSFGELRPAAVGICFFPLVSFLYPYFPITSSLIRTSTDLDTWRNLSWFSASAAEGMDGPIGRKTSSTAASKTAIRVRSLSALAEQGAVATSILRWAQQSPCGPTAAGWITTRSSCGRRS